MMSADGKVRISQWPVSRNQRRNAQPSYRWYRTYHPWKTGIDDVPRGDRTRLVRRERYGDRPMGRIGPFHRHAKDQARRDGILAAHRAPDLPRSSSVVLLLFIWFPVIKPSATPATPALDGRFVIGGLVCFADAFLNAEVPVRLERREHQHGCG